MFKLPKSVRAHWNDIKGNAKWDFIKLCCFGALLPSAAAFIRFLQKAPWWQVMGVLIGGYICLVLVIWIILKLKGQKTEENVKSDLKMEGVPLDIKSAQKHLCQIRIRNDSQNKTADNVRVELIELEDALGGEAGADYFRPRYPVTLKSETGENTINPGASLKFNLFIVTASVKTADRAPDGTVTGWQQKFIAYFTQETTKNLTMFSWKKPYRIRLMASARDFFKIEQQFVLSFSEERNFCRFNLVNATLDRTCSVNHFLIHSAIYGIEQKYIDVTEIVRAYVVDGKLEVLSGNQLGGDPRPNLGKVLTIDYSINNKRQTKFFPEGQIARLP